MQREPRYRLPASGKSRAVGFRWLLGLLVIGSVAWVWWRFREAPPQPALPRVAATNRPAPPPPQPSPVPPAPTLHPTPAVTSAPPIRVVQTSAPPPAIVVTAAPPVVLVPRTNPPPHPPGLTVGFPRPVQNLFEAQLALARQSLSPGSIDGVMGAQTRAALLAFQTKMRLHASGDLDEGTKAALQLESAPLTAYVVTSNDVARLQPLSPTWLGKSQQSALDYETILELVAEKGQASPNLIRRLNPNLDWTTVREGTLIQIPDVPALNGRGHAAAIHILLADRRLEVFDDATNLMALFPCSIAARVEKRPVGELHVQVVIPNPNYTFNPAVFPESEEAQRLGRKLVLPPGPNNPVGVAWIGLDRPGYGIHGTPSPEQVGRTESHGCFRLANWNAEYLARLVWKDMPVVVEP